MDGHAINAAGTTTIDPERAWRCCLLISLRELRRSVLRGRPMSLPNLLRVFRRRWGDAAMGGAVEDSLLAARTRLSLVYRMEQPFDRTNWRRARRFLLRERPSAEYGWQIRWTVSN